MNRTIQLLTLCAILAAAATSAFAQKPKPSPTPAPCPADVTALHVQFADAEGDLYRSDNGQPYTTIKSKSETVDIRLQRANCSYDLTMNLNSSARTTRLTLGVGGETRNSEFFNFDRVASVPVTDGGTAFLNWCAGGVQKGADGNVVTYADGTAQDNYGGCGVDELGRHYVLRSVGIQAGDASQGFRYQYSTIDNGAAWAEGTSFIRVYHPSANAWELSPESITGSWGRLHNNTTNSNLGDFSVPFRIMVTRLN
jgi:hypothetical protein